MGLHWALSEDGYRSGLYRIRRLVLERRLPWTLEVSTRSRRAPWSTRHATLRSAKATAEHIELDRVRSMRVKIHAWLAVAGTVAFATIAVSVNSIGAYAAALIALAVALRSFAHAVSERYGDAWGWERDGGAPAPGTRFVDMLARRFVDLPEPIAATADSALVRVLPPAD